jgi:uncharacterized protein YcaQ
MIEWTKKQARDYLVNYHMINTDKHHSISDVFNRLQSIQYDPLNVVGTNPELVLQSRVHNFKKEMLYNALYKDRFLIDGWDKQMCIYQTKHFPHLSLVREQRAAGEISSSKHYLDLEFEHLIEDVYTIIESQGPILSSKIKLGETKNHRWGHTKASSVTLSYLFHKGEIGIESRNNTQKKYDLIHKIHPEINSTNPFDTDEEFIEYYLFRRIQSLGLVWNKSSVAFSGLHINKKSTRETYLEILKNRELIEEITIEGIKEKLYVPTTALDYPIELSNRISIIAPLDNIIWDRALVLELFNFKYTWEVYVPKVKRKYGYYVLPLLKGSDIIGRIEFDKQRNTEPLKIINMWLEPNIKRTKTLEKEIDKALKKFAKYLGIKELLKK